MKVAAIVSSAILAGSVAAQDVQSKPFHLVVKSSDKSLNGREFSTCHEGAAIESLCLGEKTTYHFNTTEGSIPTIPGDSASGVLTYSVPAQPPIPSVMTFYADPSTNVALPLFEPGYNAQYVSFDKDNLMNILTALDDTHNPPTDTTFRALYRWYVCESNYQGYQYETLGWVYGNGKPQNPSCVKVDVKRVFF